MLWLAVEILRHREGARAARACWRMFGHSLLYLFGLFAAILADKSPCARVCGDGDGRRTKPSSCRRPIPPPAAVALRRDRARPRVPCGDLLPHHDLQDGRQRPQPGALRWRAARTSRWRRRRAASRSPCSASRSQRCRSTIVLAASPASAAPRWWRKGRARGARYESRSRCASTQRQRSALKFEAETTGGQGRAGRCDDGLLPADQHLRPRDDRRRELRRRARRRGRLLLQDPVHLLHRPDAEAGETREEAVVVLRRSAIETNRDARIINTITCPTPSSRPKTQAKPLAAAPSPGRM